MQRLLLLSIWMGCTSSPSNQVRMSFAREHGLYDAPFPSDELRKPDGTIALDKIPNPDHIDLIDQGLKLLQTQKGFATSAGIYFQVSAPLDVTKLPDLAGSMSADSPIFLVAVDTGAADFMQRRPINVAFYDDGGPFGASNLLSLVPLQGWPMLPSATYAAVVTTRVVDKSGHALGPSPELEQLVAGKMPPGMSADGFASYSRALGVLKSAGITNLAALAVFTTGDPSAEMGLVRADMLSRPLPSPSPFVKNPADVSPSFCVFESQIDMPDYQDGTTPFSTSGGQWQFDANGKPILQRMSASHVALTIPTTPMPANGYPVVVFITIGSGGDRGVVDRGPCATEDFTVAINPDTGPALEFAKAGFAGIEVDGPVTGLRNPGGDMAAEALEFFNFQNAAALRDNVRETAAELMLFAHVLPGITAPSCNGSTTVKLDTSHIAIFGHSNGAWVAPIAMSYEPMYGAGILSGAGASYIANIMDKQKPLKVRPLAEIVLNYNAIQRDLTPNDPGLMLVQWGAEPSDPQVYDRRIILSPQAGAQPRNILMVQGIVDHYILPSIANSTSLAMGLDLGGPALDGMNAEEQMLMQPSIATMLPLTGGKQLTLPAKGNAGNGAATALVVQHNGDAIEDGHEVIYQTDAPKHQYRCFLQTWAQGVPTVPADGAVDDPCTSL
jgi:hypothetical protein